MRRRTIRTGRLVLTVILGLIIITRIPASGAGPARPGLRTRALTHASSLALPSSTVTPAPSPTRDETSDTNVGATDILIAPPEGGIPEHTLDIVLNARDRRMQVSHHILLHNSSQAPWTEIVLSVMPASRPGVFILDEVEVTQPESRQRVAPDWEQTMLHVPLPTPLASGEPAALRLTYTVAVPPLEPTTGFPEGNLGAGERVIQVGDWHPTLVPYRLDGGWQTWTYHPMGDPAVYPAADYNVRIFADPNLVIAAPGAHSQQGRAHHYRLERARAFAFLASPDYQRIEATAAGISVFSYALPEHAEASRAAVDIARQALSVYQRAYGPYPLDELVIAENAYHSAMEYSGLISISRDAYERFEPGPQSLLVSLVTHEIAHQWWYHAVGSDQVHEPWLDEAFAKYSEGLYYDRMAPDIVGWWWEHQVHSVSAGGVLDVSIYAFEDKETYIGQIYTQGASFLDDLRWLMGEAAFFEFVRAYRRYGEGRIVTTEDFFTLLRAHTDADLAPLVDRYFARKILSSP